MHPVMQTRMTDTATGVVGNCLEACFASILEIPIERLPANRDELREALHQLGWQAVSKDGTPPSNDEFYIVSFTVPFALHQGTHVQHCVIWRNGEVVHDPSPMKPERVELTGYYLLAPKMSLS